MNELIRRKPRICEEIQGEKGPSKRTYLRPTGKEGGEKKKNLKGKKKRSVRGKSHSFYLHESVMGLIPRRETKGRVLALRVGGCMALS